MDREKYDFQVFRKRVEQTSRPILRAPITEGAYSRYAGYGRSNAVNKFFDLEDIQRIIRTGDPIEMRKLSRYYFRTNGIYRNAILLLANMPTYDNVVIPLFDEGKKVAKTQLLDKFYSACRFVDNLNVKNTFTEITLEALISGIYYGILRESPDGKITVQSLPIAYCRSRFKDYNNLNLIEFNVQYFNTITDENLREECVESFPEIVQAYWEAYKNGKIMSPWIQLPAEMGGCCFFYGDKTPLLVSAIPEIARLEYAVKREAKRDENELYKLLIERMPIDNKGQLVFQLDEVADIHQSVAQMLEGMDTIDVLTTFGETSLESLQDQTSATASSDRIKKYEKNAYDNIGICSQYFNPETASAMPYAIAKDEAFLFTLLAQYSNWIKFCINERFTKTNLNFNFEILPITVFNKEKVQSQLFQGAQYGYSKIYAGAALGIKQLDVISLMEFENNILEMDEKMIPLLSSYTSSALDIQNKKNVEKTQEKEQDRDISSEEKTASSQKKTSKTEETKQSSKTTSKKET